MKIYRIREAYVEYLRTKEPQVLKNKNESRPYIGTILLISGFTYFVPLSSPKPKHKKMKNTACYCRTNINVLKKWNLLLPKSVTVYMKYFIQTTML